MNVHVTQLVKHFGDSTALKGIDLAIESQELFFLLGPSGCGKTTLLRTLAGFYEPDSGEVSFGGKRMNGIPPDKRNAGMVFQSYALWPHMTVAQNVAYGLEVRQVNRSEIERRVQEALVTVRMESFATRSPNQLSGGQQQRVALARALVVRPDVLLLDEPLSNLDAKLRLELRDEIRRINAETRLTTIYVTHDQKEALSLADRIAVFREGRIEQVGDPRTVYRQPANRFVADFIGETNWMEAVVENRSSSELQIGTPVGPFVVRVEGTTSLQAGTKVWLGFRPEGVELTPSPVNTLAAEIVQVSYLGEIEQYHLRLSDGTLIKAFEQNPREIRKTGTRLQVQVRPENLLVLPR